eukprot:1161256-Pelagomonas_calceolata.AAC.2
MAAAVSAATSVLSLWQPDDSIATSVLPLLSLRLRVCCPCGSQTTQPQPVCCRCCLCSHQCAVPVAAKRLNRNPAALPEGCCACPTRAPVRTVQDVRPACECSGYEEDSRAWRRWEQARIGEVGFWQHAAPGHQSCEWAWNFLGMGIVNGPAHSECTAVYGL